MIQGLPSAPTAVLLIITMLLAKSACPLWAANHAIMWRQYVTHEDAITVVITQTRIIDTEQNSAEPYILRGNAYFELREFDSAIDDFTKAIAISDADLAYFGRGMARGRAGIIEDGIKDLSIFIERNPDSSLAYTKRGIRHFWNNNKAAAEKDLRKAIDLNPHNAEAHDDLGVILAQRGHFDQAIKHFNSTVSIDPTYQKGFHNLALVYYITDRNDEALASADKALLLQPDTRNTMVLKGNILKALGKHEEAGEVLEAAEFLPEGGWSEQAPVN